MISEDKLAAARQRIQEVEASMLLALTSARTAIASVEEENRELRRAEMKRRTEFYTEAEFAALLKVSESTIARIRKREQIEPLMVGGLIRYSTLHIERAHEIFADRSNQQHTRARGPRRHQLRQVK